MKKISELEERLFNSSVDAKTKKIKKEGDMEMKDILKEENVGKTFQNGALNFEVIKEEGELIPYSIQFGEDVRKIFNYEFMCKINYIEISNEMLGFLKVK